MFITPAYAQGLGGGGAETMLQMVPIAAMFAIFYFLLIRPQQQKAKAHQETVAKLKKGDNVVLGGGIMGTVSRVREGDPEIDVEIAKGTIVKVIRSSISGVVSKTEAA
jgi:preprotein translocase subunit YajC